MAEATTIEAPSTASAGVELPREMHPESPEAS